MHSNSAANKSDLNELEDPKKQWQEIDDQLRDMQNLLNEETSSPLSSSPANRSAAVIRSHSNQYNPMYRRSEGDILGANLTTLSSANPPQSAPVLPEGFELKWDNQKSCILPEVGHRVMASNKKDNIYAETSNSKGLVSETSILGTIPEIKHGHSKSAQDSFAYMRTGNSSPLSTIHPTAMKLHSSNTGSTTSQQYSPYKQADAPHPSIYPLHHQTSSPLLQVHKSSPSARRKSAPIPATIMRNNVRPTQRTVSQHTNVIPNIFPAFSEEEFTGSLVQTPEEETQATDVNNDKEYTRALLQHQRDRMIRLEKEIESKKNQLKLLYDEVKKMELKIVRRNPSNKALPSLQTDVSKLREINRKLKIDCNCMFKEVELFSRDGDSTSDDFYSRYDRPQSIKTNKSKKDDHHTRPMYHRTDLPPPPAPPPSESGDEAKWRCSHCTFDNHAALNKCEMCLFSRVVNPGRT